MGNLVKYGKLFCILLLAAGLLAGCGKGKKKSSLPDVSGTQEPDKVLYERAQEDIKKGRHTIGRLTLQTLINTYPDSEYLAKAKLSICESFYKEGGSASLTQAVAECKDFITFFPYLKEAPQAQMLVAMAHYRRMEKPDRDRTYTRLAEEELQQFLLKYPDDPLAKEAQQRLREVQEVLAEGDFRIAQFYYRKATNNGYRAAHNRLKDLVERYPLYSNADNALWMLGNIYERAEQGQVAARYYARIAKDYPLSPLLNDAKGKLVKLGVPIPQPDPEALARMQAEQNAGREKPGMLRRSLGLFKSGPDVSTAAQAGNPTMTPPSETTAVVETLTPGGTLSVSGTTGPPGAASSGSVGSTPPPAGASSAATDGSSSKTDPAASTPGATKTEADKKKEEEAKNKKEKESTSKKKKGLRKIIPW